jgi:hypothetical protein
MQADDEVFPSKVDELLSETFVCPILLELMSDPVVAADGHSYERSAIMAWIERNGAKSLSPITGKKLRDLKLKTNNALRIAIGHYKDTLPRRLELELTEQKLNQAIQSCEKRLFMLEAENAQLRAEVKSSAQLIAVQHERERQQHFLPEAVSQLLHYTMIGDTGRVREYLKCNTQLVNTYGDVTDKSKRFFSHITGFQLSVWTGHEAMQGVYLEWLSYADANVQLMILLKERTDILRSYGAPLSFFERLLKAIDFLRDNYDRFTESQRIAYFHHSVGDAFRNMPSWFVNIFFEEGEDKAWPMNDMTREFAFEVNQLNLWFDSTECAFVRGANASARSSTWTVKPSEWMIGLINAAIGLYHAYCRNADKQDLFNHDRENIAALKLRCTKNLERLTARLAGPPKIIPVIPLPKFTQLMYFMVRGNVDNIRTSLNQNKEVLYEQGEFHSIRGESLPTMTAFQYAVWSGHEEVWELILNFLPESEAYKQLSALLKQRSPLHFFDELIRAYDHYAHNLRIIHNEEECVAIWRNEVSPAQCNMPAWFVHIFWAYPNAPIVHDAKYLTQWYGRNDHSFAAIGGGGCRMSDGSFDSRAPERFKADRQKCLALREEGLKKVEALVKRLERVTKIELTPSPLGIRK